MTTFNILNPEEIDDFIEGLCVWATDKPIDDWFQGIFKNWLRQQPFMMKRVVKRSDLNSPWLDILQALYADMYPDNDAGVQSVIVRTVHIVSDEELPEWALRDLAVNKPVHFFDRSRAVQLKNGAFYEDRWKHYADFMEQELKHKKVFKYSVEDMEKEVTAWDKRLTRKKIIGEMADGVIVIQSQTFDDSPYILVRLDKKRSYENEGAAMRHCVKDYFGKENTHIYSVRSVETGKPVMTVEHNTREDYFLQKRGVTNSTPPADVLSLFDIWADTEGKIGRGTARVYGRRIRRPVVEDHDFDDPNLPNWAAREEVGDFHERVFNGLERGPVGAFPEIGGIEEDQRIRSLCAIEESERIFAVPNEGRSEARRRIADATAEEDVRHAAKIEQERLVKQREREDKTIQALDAVNERRARRHRT